MQNEDQNKLYTILKKPIPSTVMASKNRAKTWEYGYHKKYDLVVISKNGTLGDVYEINGVKVGLPKMPKKVDKGINKWQTKEYPKELQRIRTVFDWSRRDNAFKNKWVDFVENEFDIREYGY